MFPFNSLLDPRPANTYDVEAICSQENKSHILEIFKGLDRISFDSVWQLFTSDKTLLTSKFSLCEKVEEWSCSQFSWVQFTQLCPTLCDPLSITNPRSSLRLTSIESVIPSSHLILCHPLLLLPPIPPSIRVFSNESTLPMRWPKY